MALLNWKMLGEVTIDGTNKDFTLSQVGADLGAGVGNPVAIALTEGRYADVRVLCNDAGASDFESKISGVGGGQNYTVSIDNATGFVTIATNPPGGAVFGIIWTDVALRNLLGFTGNLAGANTYTATSMHQLGFYADRAIRWRVLDETETEEALTFADDGTHTADYFYEKTLGQLEYQYIAADEENELKTFWEDIVRQSLSINFYPNQTVNTKFNRVSNPYGCQRWVRDKELKGFSGEYPHRPYSAIRRIAWKLRKDIADSDFFATGT